MLINIIKLIHLFGCTTAIKNVVFLNTSLFEHNPLIFRTSNTLHQLGRRNRQCNEIFYNL